MRLFAGIDGGGTKSRIVVSDAEGTILTRAVGECTNQYAIGFDRAVANIKSLIDRSLSSDSLAALCLASAGLGRGKEREAMEKALGLSCPLYLTSDAEALLVGGIGGLSGMCLICGTGSIAMARDEEGNVVRSGGFGWRLGDEGSAWWQGQSAIARSLKSREGRDLETGMLPLLMEKLGAEEPEEIIGICNSDTLDKATIASLSPLVTDFAKNGDPLALSIVRDSVSALVGLLDSVSARLPHLRDHSCVIAGGVLEHDEFFRSRLFRACEGRYHLVPPRGTALDGALCLARSLA